MVRVKGNYPTRKAIQLHPDLIPLLRQRHPPRINNEDRRTLMIYNHYLAQDEYGLDVKFAIEAIIPTPQLRFFFLKQVLKNIGPNVKVLEIGTGASAIIALLAAKCFGVRVFATEIDPDYVKQAKKNIRANYLEDQIKIWPSNGGIIENVVPNGFKADYIISNPPYYDKILSPKIIWGGKPHELISTGDQGENFIINLIEEGWSHLNFGGVIAFIIPKTRQATLIAVESFLNNKKFEYEIISLLAGNRTRFVFIIHKKAFHDDEFELSSEM
ncbi:MAG: RlmF-related methyltransferase [Promethearchaeota archaeon]